MAQKANPLQKKMYDMTVLQAMRLLYEPKQAQMLEHMAKQGNPAEAISSVTAMVLKQIQNAASSAGHKLDMRFIVPAAKEIVGHLVEMLVAFKTIPQESAQQVIAQAMQMFQSIVGGQSQQPQQGLLAQGVQ